jgi:hypothetical protein
VKLKDGRTSCAAYAERAGKHERRAAAARVLRDFFFLQRDHNIVALHRINKQSGHY